MKICSKCKIEKDESKFWKNKNNKSGYEGVCIECRTKARNKNREKNNIIDEKPKELNTLYTLLNKHKINAKIDHNYDKEFELHSVGIVNDKGIEIAWHQHYSLVRVISVIVDDIKYYIKKMNII